ncbi:MAG TPA: hypothetical protein VJU84_08030 [Pyrinomonadaceae bacterium]|nr:hypothetical protein [Pyrinomonadaceae bacterium]
MKSKPQTGRRSYRHGKNKVYLQPVEDVVAVRYAKAKEELHKALSSFGKVKDVEQQQIFLVQLRSASDKEKVLNQVQSFIDNGAAEAIVPVWRDEESQLLQVLTDEVTVRFKRVLPKKEREQVEKKFGFTIARQNEFVPNQFVVKVPVTRGADALKVANELDADDEVEFAAPNFVTEHKR